MITANQMIAILVTRKLQLVPIYNPSDKSLGWVARTIDGTRAAPKNTPYPTPEDAVEAADKWLSQAETLEKERGSQRAIQALEKGKYFIRPKEVLITDEQGNPGIVKLFSAFLIDGTATSIADRESYLQAVIDAEKAGL